MVESQCHQKKMAGNHAGRYPCACPNKDNNTKKAPLPRYKNVFPERSAADGAAYGAKPILHWRKAPLTCENTEVVSNGPDLNQTLLDDGSRHCCYRKKKNTQNKNGIKDNEYCFSHRAYLQKKCKTYKQNSFNYDLNGTSARPHCSQKACNDGEEKTIVYKRSNSAYSHQGAVSAGARIHRLKYNTITTDKKTYIGGQTQNKDINIPNMLNIFSNCCYKRGLRKIYT